MSLSVKQPNRHSGEGEIAPRHYPFVRGDAGLPAGHNDFVQSSGRIIGKIDRLPVGARDEINLARGIISVGCCIGPGIDIRRRVLR